MLGLLNQLLELKGSQELYDKISTKFSGRGWDLFSGAYIQDLWDCLEEMIQVIAQRYKIYLVLDGLDECDSFSRTHLTSQLRNISNANRQDEKNPVRIVIFSRPLDLHHRTDLTIDLHADKSLERTNEDIQTIVEASCQLQRGKEQFCI